MLERFFHLRYIKSPFVCLQNALKSANERSLAEQLTASDRALLWLSYIHLSEFNQLPCSFYNPAESGPTRLVSRESFLLPWRTVQDISTPPDTLIALFEGREEGDMSQFLVFQCDVMETDVVCAASVDAVSQCSNESASPRERIQACLPLQTNLILLLKLLDR